MDRARSHYLERLGATLASLESEGRSVFSEICIEIPRLDASRGVYRLYVVDLLERRSGGGTNVLEVNVDPIEVETGDLPVDSAISWNGIEFRCSADGFPEDAVASWAARWITDESPPMGPQDGFTGIIHSVTEPTLTGSQVAFSVDFGSAPIAALDELIALLGSSLCSLGSYSLARPMT